MNNRPKILMLGWEFPPVINGGLGVACHDLASAMSKTADIVMVIPKASPGFAMKKLKLVGANNLDPRKLSSPGPGYRSRLPYRITEVLADLDPYYTELSDPIKGVNSA